MAPHAPPENGFNRGRDSDRPDHRTHRNADIVRKQDMAVPDLDQHGGWLREVILWMKQKWPVTHVAERVALLIEDVDGQRIAWFCAFDEYRTGYRIPVIALLSHGEEVFGGGMLRHAGAAAARVLGFD